MSAKNNFIKITAIIFLAFFVLFSVAPARAEVVKSSTQAELEQQLNDIEQQIAEYEKQLTATVSQKKTLANKIKQLKIKQQELNALIKQTSLQVTALETNISATEKDLSDKVAKEARIKATIGAMVRSIHERDTRPIMLLASGAGLSSALAAIQSDIKVTGDLRQLADEVQALEVQIVQKKQTLEDQKLAAVNLLAVKSIQRKELVNTLTEQNTLLIKTKGLEANYASSLADSKKRAAAIRSRIYELFNTGSQVNFGTAVDIAKLAAGFTGVRPAFLLAILTQESNLGKNVGTCNRAGDPPEKSWQTVMKPDRDQEPFALITKELGLDTDTTPVSCPMKNAKGKQIGWGGGMGPAQFIPSTWLGFKGKVAALTGKPLANPWDIRDAFVAAALKLKSNGADSAGAGEWKAAMLYFSGSTNRAYRFYGDNVIATAKKYQIDIDELN